MLRTMRNDFKKYSWTLWLVILAFVGGFILTDAFSGKSQGKQDIIHYQRISKSLFKVTEKSGNFILRLLQIILLDVFL